MKHNITILLSAFLLAVGFGSCKDEESANDASSPVIVNRFYPTTGGQGTEILITGKNFSTRPEEIKVTVGKKELKVLSSNMNNIMAIVPAKLGDGLINVQVGNREPVSSIEEFKYVYTANVTTLAGNGEVGYSDGTGTDATFHFDDSDANDGSWRRGSVCTDNEGNIYVSDIRNYCIRKITPDGTVTTFAGTQGVSGRADGTGAYATFTDMIYGMDTDAEGNIWLTDTSNWLIRKITPQGAVTTCNFNTDKQPWFIAIDKRNGDIYYSVQGNGIFKYDPNSDNEQQITANGTMGFTIDEEGNIYACDYARNSIVKYTAGTWEEEVIAGNGELGSQDGDFLSASFNYPVGIDMDSSGDLYVACEGNNIRRLDMTNRNVSTIAGTETAGFVNGIGTGASFNRPLALTIDNNDNIYVFDKNNNAVRKIIYQ